MASASGERESCTGRTACRNSGATSEEVDQPEFMRKRGSLGVIKKGSRFGSKISI